MHERILRTSVGANRISMRKYIVYFQGRVFFLSNGQYPFSSKCEENKLKKRIRVRWGKRGQNFSIT